jgi:hypothetical protein
LSKAVFDSILASNGTPVIYHREEPGVYCPCRTPEGFRSPAWHKANPSEPVCNEQGILPVVVNFPVNAFVQPATGGQRGRGAERISLLLGEVQRDDHFGVFPTTWQGNVLDFSTFSDTGEDYILYDGRRFIVVASDKLKDTDGVTDFSWEVGLRLAKTERPV